MARKVFGDSLKNAMGNAATPDEGVDLDLRRTSPTVARAQASVLEEDKHATRLIDPSTVRMSAVMDRIDPSDGLEELVSSIREHGQKVPILVRRTQDGALEIVYGRRRLLACRELGQKVRATVMEMTEEEALIAQGVENNARQDPSFIERALFVAGIIRELGKTDETRKNAQTIAYRALQIDESRLSDEPYRDGYSNGDDSGHRTCTWRWSEGLGEAFQAVREGRLESQGSRPRNPPYLAWPRPT